MAHGDRREAAELDVSAQMFYFAAPLQHERRGQIEVRVLRRDDCAALHVAAKDSTYDLDHLRVGELGLPDGVLLQQGGDGDAGRHLVVVEHEIVKIPLHDYRQGEAFRLGAEDFALETLPAR